MKNKMILEGKNLKEAQRKICELTIALVCLVVAAVFYNAKKFGFSVGRRAILIVGIAVITNIAIELLFGKIRKKSMKEVFTTQFPWVTGLIFALTIPVNTNLYVVAMTTVIAVLFGKVLFGGYGQNLFNPAAIGRAIVASSFSNTFLSTVFKVPDAYTSATPATVMNAFHWLPTNDAFTSKAFAQLTLKDVAWNNPFGAMGEIFVVLTVILAIILVIRKVIDWRLPLVYIGTMFISSWIIGTLNGVSGITYPLIFVMSGGAVFAGVFMLSDPITSPKDKMSKYIYAFGAAILTMIIRYKASAPDGVIFAILIMNMLTPLIEDTIKPKQIVRKTVITASISMLVVGIATVSWIGMSVEAKAPSVELGTAIKMNDEALSKYEVLNLEKETVGNDIKYIATVNGYGMNAEYPKPEYKENIYEVVVSPDKKIVSVSFVQFGDTVGVGDVVDDPLYFDTFIGKDLSSGKEEYDTVSSATMTSQSLISVLRAIHEDLGK